MVNNNTNEEKWISRGFPSNPSWGWNKAAPKKSLYDIGMAKTANNFIIRFLSKNY